MTICASLHVPNPPSERDAMIAATSIEHGFTVATRNTQDFVNTGAMLFNPWQEAASQDFFAAASVLVTPVFQSMTIAWTCSAMP